MYGYFDAMIQMWGVFVELQCRVCNQCHQLLLSEASEYNISSPDTRCALSVCTIYPSPALLPSAVCFHTNGCSWSQNNKRSSGMSSHGLLAKASRQLPAGIFLSNMFSSTSSPSTYHISTPSCSSTSPILPLSPLEVEVEVPWGKITGLQWTIKKTNAVQHQVVAIQWICWALLCSGWACTLVGPARADGQPWHLQHAPAGLATWHTGSSCKTGRTLIFQITCLDLPGHGQSSPLPAGLPHILSNSLFVQNRH